MLIYIYFSLKYKKRVTYFGIKQCKFFLSVIGKLSFFLKLTSLYLQLTPVSGPDSSSFESPTAAVQV